MADQIEPFMVSVDDAALDDLRGRLRRARWPERETVSDWSQGVPLGYLQDLCGYWASRYDWRATEARLNQIPQFTTRIDGLDVHFLHLRSPYPNATPLIMTHGWPGSFLEFEQVLGPLTDPPAHGVTQPTPSTWSCRRFLATGSAASQAAPAGTSTASPGPGLS